MCESTEAVLLRGGSISTAYMPLSQQRRSQQRQNKLFVRGQVGVTMQQTTMLLSLILPSQLGAHIVVSLIPLCLTRLKYKRGTAAAIS